MNLYHIVSTSDNVPYATDDCIRKVRVEKAVCPGCSQVIPGVPAVDAQLKQLPDQTPIMVVPELGIGVIRQAFIEALGRSFVEDHLTLGVVTDESGKIVSELATFRGKCQTQLRGNERSTFSICKQCGRPMYTAMGRRNVLRSDFHFKPLSESDIRQLVVDQETLDRIDLKRWKKITVEELPLVDAPADGLSMRLEDQRVTRAPEF